MLSHSRSLFVHTLVLYLCQPALPTLLMCAYQRLSSLRSFVALLVSYGLMFSVGMKIPESALYLYPKPKYDHPGMGICYAPPIVCCVNSMPQNKGLVTGIVVAGFGAGAFIFGGLASYLSNPDGLNVDSNTGYFPPGNPHPRLPYPASNLRCTAI